MLSRSLGKYPKSNFWKEGSKSGGARVFLCCAHFILYAHLLCECGRVMFFDILLTIWDTFGKLLGAAGGPGKVVGTPWGGFQGGPGGALGLCKQRIFEVLIFEVLAQWILMICS